MHSFSDSLAHFKDRRLVTIFCFGIASGFPWIMIGSVLSAWLKDASFSRTDIGLFGLVFGAYTINFLWSPLVDRIKLPLIHGFGRRRSWIISMQSLLILFCLCISQLDLDLQLWWLALFALGIAVCSATQDIAIDAFRIDTMAGDTSGMTASSSMATAGWWTGYGGLGAIPFFIADIPGWSWHEIYVVLAIMMACISVFTFFAKEPDTQSQLPASESTAEWIFNTLVRPFEDYFLRNGLKVGLFILLFVFSFKIGEAFLGRMSIVFYKELGFSNTEIGTYSKLINWWVTIIFSILGGAFTIRFGVYKGLVIAGVAMAASNLLFSVMAQVGPSPSLFITAVVIDGFTASWSTVAMVSFISLLCNHNFSASQYALMASLSAFGRTALSGSSGWLVDLLDGNWIVFFALTAIMVIPALILLKYLRKKVTVLS